MRSNGLLIIVVGLVILYLGFTGRFKCFSAFLTCLSTGKDCECNQVANKINTPIEPLKPLGAR